MKIADFAPVKFASLNISDIFNGVKIAACDELPSTCSGPEPVEGSRVECGKNKFRNIGINGLRMPTTIHPINYLTL